MRTAKKRAVYDAYGYEGLRVGVAQAVGITVPFAAGYQYHGKPEDTFQAFFGDSNPFQGGFRHWLIRLTPEGITGATGSTLGKKFGGLNGMGSAVPANNTQSGAQQDAPLEYDLECTLAELYHGAVKRVKLQHRVLDNDGAATLPQEKTLTIEIKRGWKAGTRLVFPREGHQGPNKTPCTSPASCLAPVTFCVADVVFIIRQAKHATYEREGNNLVHNAELPLVKALIGSTLTLETLDGRTLNIGCSDVIQ